MHARSQPRGRFGLGYTPSASRKWKIFLSFSVEVTVVTLAWRAAADGQGLFVGCCGGWEVRRKPSWLGHAAVDLDSPR